MKKTITTVGLGASITAAAEMTDEKNRWLNILGHKLRQYFQQFEFKMVNAGVGGNSAEEAMARFARDVIAHDPDYVILDLCENNLDPSTPTRWVNPEKFKKILQQYQENLPAKIHTVLFTTPPMYEDFHPYGKRAEFNEFFQKAGGFSHVSDPYKNIFREFAEANHYPFYDFNLKMLELGRLNGRGTYIFRDGIHMNEIGNQILADGLFEVFITSILATYH